MNRPSDGMPSWRRLAVPAAAVWAAILAAAGCGDATPPKMPVYAAAPARAAAGTYRLAVHPLHNPSRLLETYQPLADYLSARLEGARLVVEASRDYGEFERKIRSRDPEFLLPNPWQTLEAIKVGYRVIAMAGEPDDFRGLFVVRRDGAIRGIGDLKGKTLAYPSPTALAACIMPQWYLHERGLDVNRDIENRYVGSQESAIMNAYLGQTAAGVTWPPPWRAFVREHPAEAAQLQVAWETPPLVNNSVMVRSDVPAAVADQVRTLLTGLHDTPAGQALLARMETARFLPAADADYEGVKAFVARFEAEVRPVAPRP